MSLAGDPDQRPHEDFTAMQDKFDNIVHRTLEMFSRTQNDLEQLQHQVSVETERSPVSTSSTRRSASDDEDRGWLGRGRETRIEHDVRDIRDPASPRSGWFSSSRERETETTPVRKGWFGRSVSQEPEKKRGWFSWGRKTEEPERREPSPFAWERKVDLKNTRGDPLNDERYVRSRSIRTAEEASTPGSARSVRSDTLAAARADDIARDRRSQEAEHELRHHAGIAEHRDMVDSARDTAASVASTAKDAAVGTRNVVVDAASGAAHGVANVASGAVHGVANVASGAAHGVANVASGAAHVASDAAQGVVGAVGNVASAVGRTAHNVVDAAGSAVGAVGQGVGSAVGAVGRTAIQAKDAVVDTVSEAAHGAKSAVEKVLGTSGEEVSDAQRWDSTVHASRDRVSSAFENAREHATKDAKSLKEGVSDAISNVGRDVHLAADDVRLRAKDLKYDANNTLRDVKEGLHAAGDQARDTARDARDWVKDTADWRSRTEQAVRERPVSPSRDAAALGTEPASIRSEPVNVRSAAEREARSMSPHPHHSHHQAIAGAADGQIRDIHELRNYRRDVGAAGQTLSALEASPSTREKFAERAKLNWRDQAHIEADRAHAEADQAHNAADRAAEQRSQQLLRTDPNLAIDKRDSRSSRFNYGDPGRDTGDIPHSDHERYHYEGRSTWEATKDKLAHVREAVHTALGRPPTF